MHRKFEQRFKAVFDQQFQFMAILSPEGRMLEVNDLLLKAQGGKRGDYVGKFIWDSPAWRYDPGWRDIWRQRLRDAATQQAPVLSEDVYQVEDGSLRHADSAITAVFDQDGQLDSYIFQATDTTERRQAEQALRDNEQRFRALFEQAGGYCMILDPSPADGIPLIVDANEAACEMHGYTREEFIGRPVADIDDEEGKQLVRERTALIMTGQPFYVENTHVRKDGTTFSVAVNAKRIDIGNSPPLILTTEYDITQLKRAEYDALESAKSLRLLASVFENTAEGVLITDAEAKIIEVNKAFTDILGYSRDEVIGRNPRFLQSGRQDRAFYQNLWQSLEETGQWRGEIWNRCKDGTVLPEWQHISRVHDDKGELTHYVSVFSDISQIKNSQEQLEFLAHHDALTGLPNRILLNERIEQSIRHAKRNGTQIALIFLDLDNFKHVNDSLGHIAGDELLQNVSVKLKGAIRYNDSVARIGGDEFVLLLEDVNGSDSLGGLAEKLLQVLSQPAQIRRQLIGITASLGICVFPQDGNDATELLRNADAAMYRAKDQGRDNYQFYRGEMTRNAFERVQLENNLRQALKNDELLLHYQPQIDLFSGKIIGVEALIRWEHPTLGLIMPSRFISVAEDSGLIAPIGKWVLHEACRQTKKWIDQGLDIGRIAVNIAGLQIQRGGLLEDVKQILAQSGLPAERLELEITEGFIMQKVESAVQQLDGLRRLNVMLAIDDFGTGYSSLSYLKQLPVHKLKIDQSFVRDIPKDPDDVEIARAIIAMGKSMGLLVMAEGVETEEQAIILREFGCQQAQGYLYSRPVCAKEFERLFAQHSHEGILGQMTR